MSLLELHGVGARRGGAVVLENVSASIHAGEVVGLLGPNGAGKTTLMRAALGLCPAQGEIHLGGQPLAGLSPRARALAAAYIPQDRSIAWPITVATLAALGRIPHRTDARTDRAAVDAALDAVDLARLRDRPATRLSGGERARALIARALAQEAPLILADEPISGLDPAHALALMAQFRDIARAGRGVLVALHDLGLAARWCDRLILLDRGRHVLDGPPARVLTRETLSQVYGIDAYIDTGPDGLLVVPTGLAALP